MTGGLTGPPSAVVNGLRVAGMDESMNALGKFLKARRELVTPGEVGLVDDGARRVPGLRREEVAVLAGISVDYYLRLERGRDRNPSVQVLESVARVLKLDDAHLAHMLALVADVPRQRRRRPHPETPPSGILKLLASLEQPAFIENQYFDVVASNPLARALDPLLSAGGNQLRDLFLNRAAQRLYPAWENATECLVANLRQAVGNQIDDPSFIEITGELSLASERFRTLWARHEVRGQSSGVMLFQHPQVGELRLNRERMSISGADGLMLVVFHPDAGSSDADKLTLLGSATASDARAASPISGDKIAQLA